MLSLLIGCGFTELYSQSGDYYVNNYVIEPDRHGNSYFSITNDSNGLIYVSNRAGILQYDGRNWNRIPCPGAVYSMANTDDFFVVGGKLGFGKLETNEKGILTYFSLSDSFPDALNIHSVSIKDTYAFFVNTSHLYIYDLNINEIVEVIDPEEGVQFLNIMKYENDVLLADSKGKTHQIVETEIHEYNNFSKLKGRPVFITTHQNGNTLIGTNENNLYLLELNQIKKLNIKDNNYLKESDITSAVWMNDSLIAVSTLRGGIAFINPLNKKIIHITNTNTGLSDNEVLGMLKDDDLGLWVTQNHGLDRIAPFLPLMSYSNYPGLNGQVLSLFKCQDSLFVSTNLGIFKLKEFRDYSEKINISTKTLPVLEIMDQDSAASKSPPPQKKKGFFNWLFGANPSSESASASLENTDTTIVVENVSKELKSIRYSFQKIYGIDSKNSLFVKFNKRLINGGLSGLFEIKNDSAFMISSKPIRDILSTTDQKLVVSTVDGEVIFFENRNNSWVKSKVINNLMDNIQFMLESTEGDIWLSGNDAVYCLQKSTGNFTTHKIKNPYSDQTLLVQGANRIYAINPSGYFYFDIKSKTFIKDEKWEEEIGIPQKYFGSDPNNLWIYNGENWYSKKVQNTFFSKEPLINMVQDIRYIYFDETGNSFWIATLDNKIYKLTNQVERLQSNYTLLLKSISQQGNTFEGENHYHVNEDAGQVIFEFIHPDYSGVLGMQYRYKLIGLNDTWSEWTETNKFVFPYLPEGSYEIIVQSKDIFNQISESNPISFEVIPPVWLRPWFYLMEILVIIFLLAITTHINRRAKGTFNMLNRVFALVVLILVLEFVQAIAEARFGSDKSPIFNFAVQVVIATFILPFESVLRKWLTGEKKARTMIQEVIKKITFRKS